MKYFVRRFILGVISIPFVAGAYVFLYLSLLLLGAEPTATMEEVFSNGLFIGSTLAIILTFYPQFSRFVNKLI